MKILEAAAWGVEYTAQYSHQSGRVYNRNYNTLVVAPTLERAVAAVREQHPDCQVHGVHKRSASQPVLIVEEEEERQE